VACQANAVISTVNFAFMPKTSFDLLAASPKISVVWSERRFSSVVEQLIRNERVISSNLISGSPLFQEDNF
jgi:hypothetical protein